MSGGGGGVSSSKDGRRFRGSKPSRASRSFRGRVSGLTTINIYVTFRSMRRAIPRKDIAAGAVGSHEIGIIVVQSIARTLGGEREREENKRYRQ